MLFLQLRCGCILTWFFGVLMCKKILTTDKFGQTSVDRWYYEPNEFVDDFINRLVFKSNVISTHSFS